MAARDFTRFLLFTLALTFLGCDAQAQTVSFRSSQGLIFIEAIVNGSPTVLIVDTGASSSLISYKLAKLPKVPEMHNANTSGGKGFSGQAYSIQANFAVAGITVKHLNVYAGNVDDLSRRSGVHCGGLLGEDILRRFKSVRIDYRHHVIDFEP